MDFYSFLRMSVVDYFTCMPALYEVKQVSCLMYANWLSTVGDALH